MGMTRYNRILNLLRILKSNNGEIVTHELLKIEIIKNVGSDSKTIIPILKLMEELNLIEETENGVRLKV